MDPRDFQKLADTLSLGTGESEFRTAISRAYYATYHVGAEFYDNAGIKISKASKGHQQVYTYSNNSGNRELEKVASQLDDLHTKRIKADYHLNKKGFENQETVRFYVKLADQLISTIDSLKGEEELDAIRKKVKEYKVKTNS